MEQLTVKIDVADIVKLRNVIKRIAPTDGSSLYALEKQLSEAIAKNEQERKRLMGVRDANIMFYINAMVEDREPDYVYSITEKMEVMDHIIRAHNNYIKKCWGEV